MNPRKSSTAAAVALAAALAAIAPLGAVAADDKAPQVSLTATTTAGREVKVPLPDRPTVLLFARLGQEQSTQAVQNVAAALKDLPPVQVLVVLSGADADPVQVRKLADQAGWPIIRDADYALVGKLRVRVWPTSIVAAADGAELARLTGLPQSYARDLGAYLAFATGKIDRPQLQRRLASEEVVGDSAHQMAGRHLSVAQRLLDKGLLEQAWRELSLGLKLQPEHPGLQLAMARVLLMMGKPVEARTILDELAKTSPARGQVDTLRGRAMVALKDWDAAIATLTSATRLNPNAAEAYYYLGLAWQHKGKPSEAAAAYRSAFEATTEGRAVSMPAAQPPATQPAAG